MVDYLAHHGVKGMHWGVRRYQNADGTPTDRGKKRYANANPKWMDKNQSWFPSANMVKAMPRKERRDTKRYMKDSDKINRLNNKEAYKQVMRDRDLKRNYKRVKQGKEFAESEQVQKALWHARDVREKRANASAWVYSSGVMALSLAAVGLTLYAKNNR